MREKIYSKEAEIKAIKALKVENKEIANAVFYKLYFEGEYCAAARVAKVLLGHSGTSISLGLDDDDHAIEVELEKFGCRLGLSASGNTATFSLNGTTEIEVAKWNELRNKIYN